MTELLDGQVEQTFDVTPVVRRSRTLAGTGGIFRIALRNIHGGAGQQGSTFAPYTIGETGLISPFPNPIPDDFDFWLIGASLALVSGAAANMNDAAVQMSQVQQGFGIDSAGVAVISTEVFTLMRWDTNSLILDPKYGLAGDFHPFQIIKLRIPRKGAVVSPGIIFNSNATGATTVECVLLCGVFPVSLGQDVAL